MRYNPTEDEIYSAMPKIGLPYEAEGRRIKVLCPFHSDKSLGSAILYPDRNGFFKCYSCKRASNIYGLAMQALGISFKQALELVGGGDNYEFSLSERHSAPKSKKEKEVTYKPTVSLSEINFIDFDPTNVQYCRDRGLDQDFVDTYGAKLGVDGRYRDYMLIPIRSKQLLVDTFEARKIMQLDYLQQYFNSSESEDVLTERLESFLKLNHIKSVRRDNVAMLVSGEGEEEMEIDDPTLLYLCRPKTYYPFNSDVEQMLFDFDRLDTTKPLIVTEGTAGMGKLRRIHPNITAIFGSTISDRQYDLLAMFPELWIISDEDEASDLMIWRLSRKRAGGVLVYRLGDDRAADYVQKFQAHEPVGMMTYLAQRSKFFSPPMDVATIPYEVQPRRINERIQTRRRPKSE